MKGYSYHVSKKIQTSINDNFPKFIRAHLKLKTSAYQRLATAHGYTQRSNIPYNESVLRQIGNTLQQSQSDPHVSILTAREAKINEMILNQASSDEIIKKISSLNIYYKNKQPSRYNITRALNKFRKKGFELPNNKDRAGGSKQYIKLQSGGKRLIHTGNRGGKYYIKGGQNIYIK